jgi:methylmalonyl-CoA/ethylmalonyl-CoA epimerase
MILGLDHVAIAVGDLEASIRKFVEDIGLTLEGTEDVLSAQTRTAFLSVSSPAFKTQVELIAPLEGGGPVAKHLDRRGPGLHHLCFRTDDVVGDMKRLIDKGYRFTSDAPQPGAHDTLVAFLHPRSTGGVLIELAQHRSADGHAE